MYAVIEVGALQYKVAAGDKIDVTRLDDEQGKSITLDKVLLVDDGGSVKIGQPYLKDAKVTAKVLDHFRGEKVLAFKYRKRKNSTTTKGHRQNLTVLEITNIAA